jgi:hypothetical protein
VLEELVGHVDVADTFGRHKFLLRGPAIWPTSAAKGRSKAR